MGSLSENILGALRSPERALGDLIESHAHVSFHDPRRFELERMIQQLTAEVYPRSGAHNRCDLIIP